jgi:Na+-transporting methylmalonyl-CoA/oxaloacetate decarboxylase gamma subunit
MTMSAIGGLISLTVLAHIDVLGRRWEVHTLIGGSLLLIIGVQVVTLGLCALAYATYFMGERDPWFDRMRERYRLEHGLMLGSGVAVLGLGMIVAIVIEWIERGFGSLAYERLAILAATLLVLGVQVIFGSFLLSILGLRRR